MKTDFIHLDSTPGEKLAQTPLVAIPNGQGFGKFSIPEGYKFVMPMTEGSQAMIGLLSDENKNPHIIKKPKNGDTRQQMNEVFASLYLKDFDGGAMLAPATRAGDGYIIKNLLPDMHPMNHFSISWAMFDKICYQLAEFMCFLHYPTADKGALLADYIVAADKGNILSDNGRDYDDFYDYLSYVLEWLKPETLEGLATILNAEQGNPSVVQTDWDMINIGINSKFDIQLFDFGETTLSGRTSDIDMLSNQPYATHFSEGIFKNYIKIYNAKYKGRAL